MDLNNRVAVITGGAAGIGRCLVEEFAKLGAQVAFIDCDKAAGEATQAAVAAAGGRVFFFHGDVAGQADLEAFAQQVAERCRRVDYLINNACLSRKGILTPCSYEDFNYVLRVGVTAPYWLTQQLLPYFTADGAIVNISSTRAHQSQPDTESYTAAKGGIEALTHALAVSLAGRVRVNCIAPGWIETAAYHSPQTEQTHTEADRLQHPSGRVGHPMDIARAVLFLCDSQNSFINGQTITVDGGMTKLMVYAGDHGWSFDPANSH